MKDGLSKEFLAEQYAEFMKMFLREELNYIRDCINPHHRTNLRGNLLDSIKRQADEMIGLIKQRYDENFE